MRKSWRVGSLLMACVAPACVVGGFPASKSELKLVQAKLEKDSAPDAGESKKAESVRAKQALPPEVRRVIVLVPPRPETTNPKAQPRIDQARAARSKARRKPKRRLFALPTEPRTTAGATAPAKQSTVTNRRDASAPPTGSAATKNSAGKNGANKDSVSKNSAGKASDDVPPDQRVPLAQALLADILAERLHDRLGLTVVAEGEVSAALQELHLTLAEAVRPQNAPRLCARLNCQAILVPRVETCILREGATRDVILFTHTDIAGLTVVSTTAAQTTPKSEQIAGQKAELNRNGVPALHWPDQADIAGTASADRVFFHNQYKKPQGDVIRDAAQQAVNLLIHALRTDEQAPFMRATDRLAVTPIPAPLRADKLVFTPTGRRVQPSAVGNLNADASAQFTPDLLPIAPERIVEAPDARSALPAQDPNGRSLWTGEDLPDKANAQTLGRKLHVGYVLLAHVTDVELSEGAASPTAPSEISSRTAPENSGHASRTSSGTLAAPDRERAARVEAAAALVRVSDGALLWHERATATMTAPMTPDAPAARPQTDQSLVHDATRFALVELERRLRKYRAAFEK